MNNTKQTEPTKAPVEVELKDGDSVLVSATIAPQVNANTSQRIPKDKPTLVVHDWWIGMMLKSGVLTRHKI